jgi:hypothetical protein
LLDGGTFVWAALGSGNERLVYSFCLQPWLGKWTLSSPCTVFGDFSPSGASFFAITESLFFSFFFFFYFLAKIACLKQIKKPIAS